MAFRVRTTAWPAASAICTLSHSAHWIVGETQNDGNVMALWKSLFVFGVQGLGLCLAVLIEDIGTIL